MMRIRLVWFTVGFTSASAAMSQFIFRDLWAHQLSLSSQLEEKFGVLGTRVSNLELALHDTPNTQQDEGNWSVAPSSDRVLQHGWILFLDYVSWWCLISTDNMQIRKWFFLYFPLVVQIYNPVVIGGSPLSLNKIVIHFYLDVCGFQHDIFRQFNIVLTSYSLRVDCLNWFKLSRKHLNFENAHKKCLFKGVSMCIFKVKSVCETHLCQVEVSRLSQ